MSGWRKACTVAAVFLLCLAGFLAANPTAPQAQPKKFKIYAIFGLTGGGWLTAASNAMKALAATPPYDKLVDYKEVISGPDPQAEIPALESIIASGADGVMTFPMSESGLNRTMHRGCDKGVVFVTFGYSLSEPCAYQISTVPSGFGENGGQALANMLHGKGNILVNLVTPGGTADKRHYDGFLWAIKKYPRMKVVDVTYGKASDEASQAEAAKALAAHPDIDGVFTQPGELGIIRAFLASGRQKLPKIVGEGGNGFRLALANPELRARGLDGVSAGGTPAEAAYGFKLMMEILTKQRVQKVRRLAYPLPWVPADQVKICKGDRIEDDCNTFPKDKVPDSFFVTIFWPHELLPELSLTAVLQGKPTPGVVIHKLPGDLPPQPDMPGVNCEKCTAPPDLYRLTKVTPFDAH